MSDNIFLQEKSMRSLLPGWGERIKFGRMRSNELVVLVHGWLSGAVHMSTIGAQLRATPYGYSTFALDLSLTIGSLEGAMAEAEGQLKGVNFGKDFAAVHFVAHSMGGLIAKIILNRWDFPNARSLVCLGTPWTGSPVLQKAQEYSSMVVYTFFYNNQYDLTALARRPSTRNRQVRIGAIAGTKPYIHGGPVPDDAIEFRNRVLGPRVNDGSVPLSSALGLRGLADSITLPLTHRDLITSPPTAVIARFLETGKFRAKG